MSKQLYSPRFILKIQSNRLKENDWKLNIETFWEDVRYVEK